MTVVNQVFTGDGTSRYRQRLKTLRPHEPIISSAFPLPPRDRFRLCLLLLLFIVCYGFIEAEFLALNVRTYAVAVIIRVIMSNTREKKKKKKTIIKNDAIINSLTHYTISYQTNSPDTLLFLCSMFLLYD